MTREELFSVFPRPWRLCAAETGTVLDARSHPVLTVDQNRECTDEDVLALAELITDLVNEADE